MDQEHENAAPPQAWCFGLGRPSHVGINPRRSWRPQHPLTCLSHPHQRRHNVIVVGIPQIGRPMAVVPASVLSAYNLSSKATAMFASFKRERFSARLDWLLGYRPGSSVACIALHPAFRTLCGQWHSPCHFDSADLEI